MTDVVLAGTWSLRELLETVTLEESLDEIAARAIVVIAADSNLPAVEPGQPLKILTVPPGQVDPVAVFDGVVWDVEAVTKRRGQLVITAYDRAIYLAKSEDEYLFPAGQTASQRLKRYAADWQVPLGQIADTKVPLGKAVYRAQPIYSMIQADLRETAAKGGGMYRPRMSRTVLDLVALGGNTQVWALETGMSVEEKARRATLDGAVTQVKVLGQAESEQTRSPVLALQKGDTARYGTLQRVVQDSRIESAAEARQVAKQLLSGPGESYTVAAPDVPSIRAGDKVRLDGAELLTISVKHELGVPGRMVLELAPEAEVRRRFYVGVGPV